MGPCVEPNGLVFEQHDPPAQLPFLSRVVPISSPSLPSPCLRAIRQFTPYHILRPGVCSFRRWTSRSLTDPFASSHSLYPAPLTCCEPATPEDYTIPQTTKTHKKNQLPFSDLSHDFRTVCQASAASATGRTTSPVPFNHRVAPTAHTRTAPRY